VAPDEFLRDRDGARRAEPALDVEFAAVKISRIKGAERSVRENIDPENLQVLAGKIR
jgi:hypothetical protein